MKKLRMAIKLLTILIVSFIFIMLIYFEITDDGIPRSYVEITVTNQSKSVVDNLYISSTYYPKYKAFSDLAISESEFMQVSLPAIVEASAVLTYTDEFGIDHHASVIGYLMFDHEVSVTIIQADKDGIVIEVLSENEVVYFEVRKVNYISHNEPEFCNKKRFREEREI